MPTITQLEKRKVIIALPSEVWEILDSTNKMALADGGPGFGAYVADLIMASVARCLDVALALASYNGREGNV